MPPSTAQTMAELQADHPWLRRDLHFAQRQREILKNVGPLCQSERQRFESMKTLFIEYSLHEPWTALDVTRSGYQSWDQRGVNPRPPADAQLLPLLRQDRAEGRGNYGRPRSLAWLASRGIRCGHTRA